MRFVAAVAMTITFVLPRTAGAQTRIGHAAADTQPLVSAIANRIAAVPGADVAVSYLNLGTGERLELNAHERFHAASTMKIPVMLEVLGSAQDGRLPIDQRILLINRFHSIVDGSPYELDARDDSDSSMYARVGERVPVRELLERMIVRSSNLATNALIALVGATQVTATAHALGATDMQVLRGVEDDKAFAAGLINTTTAADLSVLMERVERGDALDAVNAQLMKSILLRQELNDEIPAGLPAGTRVAHKTGAITATLHDAAIVYPDTGPPYVLVVLTRAIADQAVARTLIADVSRLVWEHTVVRR